MFDLNSFQTGKVSECVCARQGIRMLTGLWGRHTNHVSPFVVNFTPCCGAPGPPAKTAFTCLAPFFGVKKISLNPDFFEIKKGGLLLSWNNRKLIKTLGSYELRLRCKCALCINKKDEYAAISQNINITKIKEIGKNEQNIMEISKN